MTQRLHRPVMVGEVLLEHLQVFCNIILILPTKRIAYAGGLRSFCQMMIIPILTRLTAVGMWIQPYLIMAIFMWQDKMEMVVRIVPT